MFVATWPLDTTNDSRKQLITQISLRKCTSTPRHVLRSYTLHYKGIPLSAHFPPHLHCRPLLSASDLHAGQYRKPRACPPPWHSPSYSPLHTYASPSYTCEPLTHTYTHTCTHMFLQPPPPHLSPASRFCLEIKTHSSHTDPNLTPT